MIEYIIAAIALGVFISFGSATIMLRPNTIAQFVAGIGMLAIAVGNFLVFLTKINVIIFTSAT